MPESRLATELAGAIDRGELILLFQPQIDIATGSVVGVEALCRWIHPDFGLLLPYAFIPIAESSGLIASIGEFVIEESCAALQDWDIEGITLELALNVSPLQLTLPRFAQHLFDTIDSFSIEPSRLTVEITENEPISDIHAAIAVLHTLNDAGITVSVDDYGVGHSSLSRLDDLPARELKLDNSLVRDETAENFQHLVDVIAFAHERSVRVVAEGIETKEQLERARALGCDRGQGFLLGKPMSARQITSLVGAR